MGQDNAVQKLMDESKQLQADLETKQRSIVELEGQKMSLLEKTKKLENDLALSQEQTDQEKNKASKLNDDLSNAKRELKNKMQQIEQL